MTTQTLRVATAIVVGVLACCGVAAKEHKGLEGTSWQLLALGPNGAIDSALPTLMFAPDGKVSGSGGCNTFSGNYVSSGMEIKFTGLTSTKKSCSDEVNAQEAAYLKALEHATTFDNQATNLSINTKSFNEPLSFVPAK